MKINYEIRQQGSGFICQLIETGVSNPINYVPKWFPDERTAVCFGEWIKFGYPNKKTT